MTRIQQSIEISVPVHVAYEQLERFEDYPRFMQDLETVQQVDDTHLHWSSKLSYQTMEWDAEIIERQPDRVISWRNTSGPTGTGKIELQPVGADKARVTLTMECEPAQIVAAPDGNSDAMMAHRLEQDLACFKALVEQGASSAATAQQAQQSTQSDASLSQTASTQSGDERFAVAEEQNFDEQSDQARRVGKMPQEAGAAQPADAMAQSMTSTKEDGKGKEQIRQAIERTVPPSE